LPHEHEFILGIKFYKFSFLV